MKVVVPTVAVEMEGMAMADTLGNAASGNENVQSETKAPQELIEGQNSEEVNEDRDEQFIPSSEELEKLKKDELVDRAEKAGVEVEKGDTKADIVQKLEDQSSKVKPDKRVPVSIEEQTNTLDDDAKVFDNRAVVSPDEQVASDD